MPPPGTGGRKLKAPMMKKREYTPLCWDLYFDRKQDITTQDGTFRVYLSGSTGPVVLFLHGGGYSALSWAPLAKSLKGLVSCQCAAIDLRGHGDTYTSDDEDLSAQTQANDVGAVVRELYGADPPQIIMVGHSMGGAIAVHTAHRQSIPSLIGLGVIDVVEGTAMEALHSMQTFLHGRPQIFKSLSQAIEYSVRSGQTRNHDSARVSMPGQLKQCSESPANSPASPLTTATTTTAAACSNVIMEEDEEGGSTNESTARETDFKQPSPPQQSPAKQSPAKQSTSSESSEHYTWRIDLTKSEKYWEGWFKGLSTLFLECPVPKMLLLAGVDRLDKDLTVGQMQGKFQMQVLPACGHAVHEDVPDRVAEVLATFMIRHKVATSTHAFTPSFPAC